MLTSWTSLSLFLEVLRYATAIMRNDYRLIWTFPSHTVFGGAVVLFSFNAEAI